MYWRVPTLIKIKNLNIYQLWEKLSLLDGRRLKENFPTGSNEVTTHTKSFLGVKQLQPPGSAAYDICQRHSKQLLSATQLYKRCKES